MGIISGQTQILNPSFGEKIKVLKRLLAMRRFATVESAETERWMVGTTVVVEVFNMCFREEQYSSLLFLLTLASRKSGCSSMGSAQLALYSSRFFIILNKLCLAILEQSVKNALLC